MVSALAYSMLQREEKATTRELQRQTEPVPLINKEFGGRESEKIIIRA
jgi:hypothetical protein